MVKNKIVAVLILMVVCLQGLSTEIRGEEPKEQIKKELIAKVKPKSLLEDSFYITPDRQHVAFAYKKGKKNVFCIDGKDDEPYADIDIKSFSFHITPDDKRYSYVAGPAWPTWKQSAVIDGVKGKTYVYIGGRTFSSDNKHVAYTVHDGCEKEWHDFRCKGFRVIIDDVEGKLYDDITKIQFDPASNQFVYTAHLGDKRFLVKGQTETEAETEADPPKIVYSDNRKSSYSFVNQDGNRVSLIVNGKETEVYQRVGHETFSPDGEHLAFIAEQYSEGKCYNFIVHDGERQGEHQSFGDWTKRPLKFSPDGRLAYIAEPDHRTQFVVLDGEEQKHYRDVSLPVFNHDGSRYAYSASDGYKMFVIIDGEEKQLDCDAVGGIAFSPDGKHLAYQCIWGSTKAVIMGSVIHRPKNTYVIVTDGTESAKYDYTSDLIFSPDSTKLVYVARVGEEEFVVVNDEPGEKYFDVLSDTLAFSPDSQNLAYVVRDKKERVWLVLNGKTSEQYDEILYDYWGRSDKKRVYFDQEGDVVYFARKGSAIYKIRETPQVSSDE